MKLYSDMVSGTSINAAEWERRAAAGTAVGKCRCGGLLTARPAERPAYSSVTYRDITCTHGHEASITGEEYKGKTLAVGRAHVDITEARHAPDLRVIRGGAD